MQYIFLAVVIVMVLLNGFMYLAVKRLADSVGKQIRSQSTRLFSIYNQVQITRTENDGEAGQDENGAPAAKEEAAAATAAAQGSIVSGTISKSMQKRPPQYRNARFLNDYKTLKKRFDINKKDLIESIISREAIASPAAKILEKLSLDSVYKLSNIASEHQERILKDLLTQEQISYIDDITGEMKRFDITELYYRLRLRAQIEDGKVHVFVPDDSSGLEDISPDVEVLRSDDICEGLQVQIGNRLYDYSIGKREIG